MSPATATSLGAVAAVVPDACLILMSSAQFDQEKYEFGQMGVSEEQVDEQAADLRYCPVDHVLVAGPGFPLSQPVLVSRRARPGRAGGIFETLSHPCPQVRRLLGLVEVWQQTPSATRRVQEEQPKYQPNQKPSLAERLGEGAVVALVSDYVRWPMGGGAAQCCRCRRPE